MRSTRTVLQVFLLPVLLKMRLFTHAQNVTWHEIYHSMMHGGDANLRTSCPWTYGSDNRPRLIYRDAKCLDLDNITEFNEAFLTEAQCQPIPSPCRRDFPIGFMCVRNRPSVIIGKRNEQKDPYMGAPISPHSEDIRPIVRTIEAKKDTADIRPIVRTLEAEKDMVLSQSHLINNINYGPRYSIENQPQVSQSSLFALMFPSYSSKNNAQIRPQIQGDRPPVPRLFQDTTGANYRFDDNNRT